MSPPRVIVIGAGAAGLMAAGEAARAGASVTLLEKMPRPAIKLRLTGKGRCNLTNIAPLPDFLAHFGPGGVFLRQAFARFFAEELIALLAELGVATVTERGGRVFPESGRATEIADALVRRAREAGVEVRARCAVEGLRLSEGSVRGVRVTGAPALAADAVVLATGGASYPATGSTGDGYRLAARAGHTIVPPRPALVPVETAGNVARRLQGLSLRNVRARVLVDGRRGP
jgi:predicted Rossmann fold flavoprotein